MSMSRVGFQSESHAMHKTNFPPSFYCLIYIFVIQAHALMEYMKEIDNDKANQLMEIMYQEYFEKGRNINADDVLEELALRVGGGDGTIITSEGVRTVLRDGSRLTDIVRKDQLAKRQMGVTGVPYFIIESADAEDPTTTTTSGRRHRRPPVAFSGAQPVDLIAEVLEEQAS